MTQQTNIALPELFTDDETAWLEAMADLIAAGAYDELDYANLREYLSDMAKRDRREVESRLVVLILHILKWTHQPDHQFRSWRGSIIAQRQELGGLVDQGVLRNHADAILAKAYQKAVERAAAETGLPIETFPAECGYSVDELLSFDPPVDRA